MIRWSLRNVLIALWLVCVLLFLLYLLIVQPSLPPGALIGHIDTVY